jgi:hypothetical protein
MHGCLCMMSLEGLDKEPSWLVQDVICTWGLEKFAKLRRGAPKTREPQVEHVTAWWSRDIYTEDRSLFCTLCTVQTNHCCWRWNFQTTYFLIRLYSPFVGPWHLFQFPNLIHSRYYSLDGGSARRKASSSGIRTYDLRVGAGEDNSCLRPRGHCDRKIFLTLLLAIRITLDSIS